MNIAVLGIRGIPANYGGFETCAEHVAKHWAEVGHNVLVYCRKNHYKERMVKYNGCRLAYMPSINRKSLDTLSHTFICILNIIFKERNIEYIHLYNGGNGIFLPLLKLLGKKVIISVDGVEWKRKKWGLLARLFHKTGERLAVKYADEIITDNKAVENYYRLKYDAATRTIPYGAKLVKDYDKGEEARILNKYNLRKREYFIFVGRLVPEKGVHNLIEAYKNLSTPLPLVIIGDDKSGGYKEKLMKLKNNKVRFLGYVYGKEYEILLKNALIYVTASELEGTSPSLLAAMGAKVCTLVNGIEENLFTIQNSGYHYRENDTGDLWAVWSKLINNTSLIDEMAGKGHRLVMDKYQWEDIADEYLIAFHELRKKSGSEYSSFDTDESRYHNL